ncbi:proline dehydrogenase family protein [Leptospira idonii]|uniref:1-pyrroline-5-carboxylate dehydrogenase n=1 Tax=Leptospira idonii TaxID=1193500 RepID=A0A4R9M2W5_9LEPT|nr:proline dehydrogenase family protein [Leptospira idonii]TGN20235.1 1-pyrroline-5-carboxylate dehydrogenase [Leptospira idonii]
MVEPGETNEKILEKGKEIFRISDSFSSSLHPYQFFSKALAFLENRPLFKLQSFRFVDLFPSLVSFSQTAKYIDLYFLKTKTEIPFYLAALGSVLLSNPFTSFFVVVFVKWSIRLFSRFFILGRDYESGRKKILDRYRSGMVCTIDILGEAVLSEGEAKRYSERYISLLEGIASDKKLSSIRSSHFPKEPAGNVSVKCSSIFSQMDPLAFEFSVTELKNRLRPILDSALSKNIFINLDMEQYETKDIILTAALEIFSEEKYNSYPHFGIVIQAYLKSSFSDLEKVISVSESRKFPLTVRLVKGAYWEFEVIQAGWKGWEVPVFSNKKDTDRNYEVCTNLLLRSYPKIRPAFASHNVRSLSYVLVRAEELLVPKDFIEVQMLYGMAEPYKKAILSSGILLREYSPLGETIPGMAYLVRRLLENSTNEGFLKNINSNRKDREKLLYLS